MAQDSSRPDFWETRYRDQVTPWDAGKVPAALQQYLPALPPGARILIPGCGSAYEAHHLAQKGFDVLAIDFSPSAVDLARTNLAGSGATVQLADFFQFDHGKPFDAIYERAFLCALPRKMWQDYAGRCARILKPGGLLAGFFFFAETPRGPPFGTTGQELDALLSPHFERIGDQAVEDSIEVFSGKERWQVWKLRQ